MPTTYSAEDLSRVFEARTLTRGRTLVMLGAVEVKLDGDAVVGVVDDKGLKRTARLVASPVGRRAMFEGRCTCRVANCVHLAATGLAGLDRFPALRRAEQNTFLDTLATKPAAEGRRAVFDLAAATPPAACTVSCGWVAERSGRFAQATPAEIVAEPGTPEPIAEVARLLGAGTVSATTITPEHLDEMLDALVESGAARWAGTGRSLVAGTERTFDAGRPPTLPAKSGVLFADTGRWYVDAATGEVGRVRIRPAVAPAPVKPRGKRPPPSSILAEASEPAIVERVMSPVLQMSRLQAPDEYGRLVMIDALTLAFDYGGVVIDGEDERQFVPVPGRIPGRATSAFVRRDREGEDAAHETLRQHGFVQMRVADTRSARGRRVHVFRGEDAGERWHGFVNQNVPLLETLGFRSQITGEFGPRVAQRVGAVDMSVSDDEPGRFSLDFGIEVDGVRVHLLPVLTRLLEQGGMAAARVVGDDLITHLEDGRVVKLPAERIGRLLGVMGDLIEAAGRTGEDAISLPDAEAPTLVELEDLLATRWQDAASIEATVTRYRADPEIVPIVVPASFKGSLRPYQLQGVAWLQHLRAHGLGGFLADDMGLGKTAQTIAHVVVEEAAGRLESPVLIIVPTSLVPNWTAELRKFAPHLRTVVLHGLDRHQRRERLGGVHVVITTYSVLTRDIEEMQTRPWHMVVLDEAQAIKSPDAKATRAVCQLQAEQRVCLSGTPIENNLEELWSQFAFLMPGLLADRCSFAKRFRTPIEKGGDDVRRGQLVRRIRPFILRRTKAEVATELPPKHTILRRVTLAPEQRELYETIRVTMHERVREQVAERSLAKSRIVVLDALLKLRQACCDPRLVKLASAREIEVSSKLDDLMEMLGEMLPEGRRVLLFSQFTSMLDLIKPRLVAAGIRFVELRGDTRDRAEPVRSFEAGEVPLFLISLKAGGRGLNLVSADTVIHYDPWWNPAVENQASDRAHRIGQTRSVFVYKMIAADTVEERILELQERKAELANVAFTEEGDIAQLEFDDIDYLFGADPEREAA